MTRKDKDRIIMELEYIKTAFHSNIYATGQFNRLIKFIDVIVPEEDK